MHLAGLIKVKSMPCTRDFLETCRHPLPCKRAVMLDWFISEFGRLRGVCDQLLLLACLPHTSNKMPCLHTQCAGNRVRHPVAQPPSCPQPCAQLLSAQPGIASDTLCRVPKGLHKRLVPCNEACSSVDTKILHLVLRL